MKLPVKPATQIDWQAPTKRLAGRLAKQKSLEEMVREMRWRRWAKGILAMCLNHESPQHSKMTGKHQTCEKFEEGLSVDDPKKEIKHTSFKLTPSQKEEVIENFLTDTFGFDRRESIKAARCAPLPIGCGKPVEGFKDALSEREFGISGLCQKCQDKIFG